MNAEAKILIVDDTPQNLKLLGAILMEQGYHVVVAQNGQQALAAAAADPPDLVLLDIMMPGMDGFAVCERLKAEPGTERIPVIFLTAKIEEEDIVRGFDLGAVDYVTKPFSSAILLARVRTHVRLGQHEHQLMQQVNLDSLSLLPNRRAFDAALDDQWRAAARSGKPLALLLADVDFLAEINDRLGHEEGDQIICEVARVLEQSEAAADAFVARYGGGEFAMLLAADSAAARATAERLRVDVEAEGIPNPYSALGKRVTVSFGGASMVPGPVRPAADLVQAAERLLVQAKQQGRNRVAVAG